jgi:hypothetical protein
VQTRQGVVSLFPQEIPALLNRFPALADHPAGNVPASFDQFPAKACAWRRGH